MTFKLKLVPRAAITAKVSPRLTATVAGGDAIDVTAGGGNYVVSLDYTGLAAVPDFASITPANALVAIWDADAETFKTIALDDFVVSVTDEIEDDPGLAFINLTLSGVLSLSGYDNGALSVSAGQVVSNSAITHGTNPVLQLSPAASSTNKALRTAQAGPSTGSLSGPIVYNLVDITSGTGSATAGFDAFGNFNSNTYGFKVQLSVGGASLAGAPIALSGHVLGTSTNTASDKIGVFGSAYTNINDAAGGLYFGVVGASATGTSANSKGIVGGEFGVFGLSGATIQNRYAVSAVNNGSARGTSIDTAYFISSGTVALGATAAGSFLHALQFSNFYGLTPMATTAKLFFYDHAATIADVFDFNTNAVTITGNIWSSPNLTIAGSSLTTLNAAGIGTTSTDRLVLQNTTAATNVLNQKSPRIRLSGAGWNGSASQATDWTIEHATGNASPNTGAFLDFSAQIAAGGYQKILRLQWGGAGHGIAILDGPAATSTTIVWAAAAVNKWYLQNQGGASDVFALLNSDANGNVNRFQITQAGAATCNMNSSALPSNPAGTTLALKVGVADGGPGGLSIDSFGTGNNTAFSDFVFRRANGTNASKSAVQSGDLIGRFSSTGYHSGGNYGAFTGQIQFRASENYTGSAQGSEIRFVTTPNTTLSVAEVVRVTNGGSMAIGATTTALGTSDLLVNGQIYGPNMAGTASSANVFYDTTTTPVGQLRRFNSSVAYKKDIEPLEQEYSDRVLELEPIWYRSKFEGDRKDWSWFGLSAEQVAEIEPRLVHWSYRDEDYDITTDVVDDGGALVTSTKRTLKPGATLRPDGVMYDRLAVLLLDVVKRLKGRLEELEARVA